MATRLKSKCPECNQTLKCDESLIGRQVRCPACRHRFVLSSIAFSNESDAAAVSVEATTTGAEDQTESSGESSQRPRPADEPTIGKIGRFELKQALGQGAFGKVYRAFDPILSRQVALKVPKFTGEEKKKIRRFLTEAKAAAGLRHPNIVAVYESGQADGELYIAAEYVRGRSLAECIEGVLPDFREAAAWIRDLAEAFAYAHDEGVIHRDIKPQNVMIGGKGRPQIMDFGLAKLMDDDSSVTGDGALLGTPAYMSPEQARGELDNVGPQSDQYSLAVVFYELMTGQKPFDGPAHSVIARVAKDEPPPPNKHNAEIPRDLEAICLKAMEKDPARRYADLHEMADDLDRLKVRFSDFQTITRSTTLPRPTNVTQEIWKTTKVMRTTRPPTTHLVIRLLGVGVSGFDNPEHIQRSLFDDDAHEAQANLDQTADQIREKFGSPSVGRADCYPESSTRPRPKPLPPPPGP